MLCDVGNKGLKAKGRKEMKREKRVLSISGAFPALWGHKLVGCCMKSSACSMLHPVVERSLWSVVWGHNWCVVRTQLSAHCLTIASAFRHKPPQSSRSSSFLLFSQSSKSFLPRSRLKSLEVEVPLRGSDKIHRCDDKRTRWERTLTTEQLTSSSKENKDGQVFWKNPGHQLQAD